MVHTAEISDDDNGGALTSEAPRIVSSLPADGAIDVRAENGVLTLQITYDQNVKITEDKPLEKIQILRSEAAVTAVTAKDKVVSVTVSGCEDGKNYEVYIPKYMLRSLEQNIQIRFFSHNHQVHNPYPEHLNIIYKVYSNHSF